MKDWGIKQREELINDLQKGYVIYDLVIIGGGITGAGILLDAVSRGFKTLLIEKDDFGCGTSSRSTKLIHGGLRYLKNLEFKIVRDTGQERAIAYKNAPHLVVPEKMMLPIQKGGTYGRFMTSIALKAYDWLAGVAGDDKRIMLNKNETLLKEPLLKDDLLIGSGYYSEYRTDDARLTLSIIKTAIELGGDAVSKVKGIGFKYNAGGHVSKVKVKDEISGKEMFVNTKQVINACGPWSDDIRRQDQSMNHKKLQLTKGVHIVFDHIKLPLSQSIYFDVPGGRMIFAIPRGKVTYVGTTDTVYSDKKENPAVSKEDVIYLVNACNNMFPNLNLILDDVKSTWAGLRPLIHEDGKSPSELSRKDEIFLSPKGMITIAGGKLTGYRLMAEKVVDLCAQRFSSSKKCLTDTIQINGFAEDTNTGKIKSSLDLLNIEDSEYQSWYLHRNYGCNAMGIVKDAKSQQIELILSEANYCIEKEMTFDLLDFFVRRTGRVYFDIDSVHDSLQKVGAYFANKLGWSEEFLNLQIEKVNQELKDRLTFI